MKALLIIFAFAVISNLHVYAQNYKPVIEPYPGLIKTDPRLILKAGYLVVPENRSKPNGPKVKLPFFFVRRPDQHARKNVMLYTTGGPGYSTTANYDSIGYSSGWLSFGGFIAMDQRGTKRAKPCLDCQEVSEAIKRSYREGKQTDSLVLAAVTLCREKFTKQGIDLSAYNTIESAEDINDLRLALGLDSLNLAGISYSGSLMLTMLRNHPEGVRSLILNSPLPGYVNFEEHALFNINEALEQVFTNAEADSSDTKYKGLRTAFRQYFSGITGKKFAIDYREPGTGRDIKITYTKTELLDAVLARMNTQQVKTVPAVMLDLIGGTQEKYVREVLDGYFAGNSTVSLGMRYSVYCTEQIAYSNDRIGKQQDRVLPWLAGYPFNNVNHAICSCWQTMREPPIAKQPVYSAIPALISAGDIDPDCRPFYNRLIKRYMPNAQLLIIHNKGHAPGYFVDGTDYLKQFYSDPFKKLETLSKNLVIE